MKGCGEGEWEMLGHGKGVEMENAKHTQKRRMAEEERPRTEMSLRYVDCYLVRFYVLQLLLITFYTTKLRCMSKSKMKQLQKPD
jgi:hypothetical protein